jgi:ATP-dependent DNA helicase RecG
MIRGELEAIISGGESDQVELKRSTGQRTEAAKTVSAMLNGRGGFVLFGVENDGNIVGQQVSAATLEDLVRELRRIEPQVLLEPEVVGVDEVSSVIVLRVPSGTGGPYTFDGRPFVRQGPTTRAMPQEQYRRVLLEQTHPAQRWDAQPAYRFNLGDLDHAEITRTVDEAIRRGRMTEPGTRDPERLLLGLGLLRDAQILNAAVALFARPEALLPYYPQCVLRMARFRGVDKSEFEDSRQELGNAFELLPRAERFLRDHLPVAGRIVPDLFARVDDPLYPMAALREALANALCHREYSVPGGSVSIAIFDDRLEIASTGTLHFGLTPDDLLRPHTSQPWNPLIASVFFRRGVAEQWGRGTMKIIQLTEQAGLVSPEFEVRGGEVVVRFFPTGYVPPSRVAHELTTLQREILEVLAGLGAVPSTEVRKHLQVKLPETTVLDNLRTLQHLGLVDKVGKTKGTRWRLAVRQAPSAT